MNAVLALQKLVPDIEGKEQVRNATVTTVTTVTRLSTFSIHCK
ncbi:class III lanthipeptide [Lysinibacillus mangiferihumi]|nr:class III lanthipeptide [Lysinibacillus mangiferihumi]